MEPDDFAHRGGITPTLPAGYEHGTARAYRHCRPSCDECKAANAAEQAERRARKRAGVMPESAHGKPTGYTEWGCRCRRCKHAYRTANAGRKPVARTKPDISLMPEEEHGTARGYGYWACRCQACRAWNAADARERAQSRRGPAPTGETVTRGFKYRIYVTPQVEKTLTRVFGCCRRVYNDFVRLADSEYQGGRPHPSYAVGWSLVSEARTAPETSWLADVPAHVLAASVKNATVAFDNFFASQTGKRKGPSVGYPRMKRKAARQTARFDENSHTIRGGWQNSLKGGGRLYLAKVGLVRVRWHRPLPSAPSAVTITRETDGRWWATFTVQVPVEPARLPVHPGRVVGVDIGTEDIALVYSDKTREKVMTLRAERDDTHGKRTGPQSYRQAEKRLAALDQELSRKTRGSNNRKRTQRKRALLHTRLKNLRTDFARQMAAQLTSENQVVVVETLGVWEMVQDAHAKSVLDTAFATITREVALAAEKRGTTLVEVPRYFAGTRTCSHCGTKGPKRPTKVRDWRCASCGAVLDRDYNASVNHLMLAAGSAESLNGWTPEDRRQLASLPGEGNHVVLERPRAVRRGSVCEDPLLTDVDSVREHSPRTTQVATRGLAPRPQGIPKREDLRDLQKDAAR